MSRYQSQKFGIGIQYLDISYHVISHGLGYDITIYRDMSCDITLNHLETPGKYKFNENPPPRCGLLLFISALSLPHLGLSSVWPFSSSFCCPSAGHIIQLGLTVPVNSNLVPSGLGPLLERMMFVLFRFSFFYFLLFISMFVFLLDTWYLVLLINSIVARHRHIIVVNVVGHFRLILCCCRETVHAVYAIHIVVVVPY